MTDGKLIEQTLSLNDGVPLFDFNVNFTALKKLLVDFNVVQEEHRDQLNELRMLVRSKADKESVDQHFALLNGAFNLSQESYESLQIAPQKEDGLRPIDDLCQKSVWAMSAVDKLLKDSANTNLDVQRLEKRLTDKIKSQTKIMEDKFANFDDTMKRSMDLYFKDANTSFARLEAKIKESETANAAKLGDALALINRKVNQDALQSELDSLENKLQSNLRRMFEAQSVKRANFSNDMSMKIKDTENAAGERQAQLQNRLAELIQKINKSLSIQGFDKEKTKLYEKLSEQRARIDDLTKKAEDYMDYKRSTVISSEKSKQQTLSILDEIGKLKSKTEESSNLGNAAALLQKLDPHKICELDAAVRLHSDLIAKLQKAQLSGASSGQPQPSGKQTQIQNPKSGLSSEEARKFIKSYIDQLDIDARIKKIEKDSTEFAKRVDTISDLQKKLYTFTKQFDFGSITREMQKKCNAQETRRDVKVTNGRIDQLHEFLKMIRKDLDVVTEFMRKNEFRTSKQPSDNALLTGKKLYPLSCLSCYSGVRTSRGNRTLRTPNIEQSIEGELNHTIGEDEISRRSSLNMRRR